MAFSDPQVLTIDAVQVELPRVETAGRSSVYEDLGTNSRLRIAHANGRRIRRTVRLDISKVDLDAYNSTLSKPYSMSAGFYVDVPLLGFTLTEQVSNAEILQTWLNVAGNLAKVVDGES